MRSSASSVCLLGIVVLVVACVPRSPAVVATADADAVIAGARLRLGAGADGALLSTSDAARLRLDQRYAEANALVDALEAYMLALREAFPTSSEVAPGSVSLALLPREAAEQAWSNAASEEDWSHQYPSMALGYARAFLDAAERLLEASAAPGETLGLAWHATATAYADWCLAVEKLSAQTETDRVATWLVAN